VLYDILAIHNFALDIAHFVYSFVFVDFGLCIALLAGTRAWW